MATTGKNSASGANRTTSNRGTGTRSASGAGGGTSRSTSRPSNARGTTQRKTAQTRRSTQGKRAAGTRAQNTAERRTQRAAGTTARKTRANAQRAESRTAQGVDQVQAIAERTLYTGVGAVLAARDQFSELAETFSSRQSFERRAKVWERRGHRVRNDVEREVKRSRTRVEREMRQRRASAGRFVDRNRVRVNRIERDAKAIGRDVEGPVNSRVEYVSAQVENAVQTGVTTGQRLIAKATEPLTKVS
jgi:hypothetical protein